MKALKRVSQKTSFTWLAPVLGLVAGLSYAIVDEIVDETALNQLTTFSPSWFFTVARDFLDFIFPVLLGLLVGLGVNLLRKQARLYKEISIENVQYQRDLLLETLISLFLHEIRNPIHNITAALEESKRFLPADLNDVVERNLNRFEQLVTQYKKRSSLFESIDPTESIELRPWLENFIDDKVRPRLRELEVDFQQDIQPVKINMHPILLERAFVALFSNAFEELERLKKPRQINLLARLLPPDDKRVEIKLANSSRGFPEEVLEKQGYSPVESKKGLGLGLTFLRKIVEQIDGDLVLSNSYGNAEVTLLIPGTSL